MFTSTRIAIFVLLALIAAPGSSGAQSNVSVTYFGYFSPDASYVITLGELTSADPTLAAELVSPQYAETFFDSFTLFTDYEFAALTEQQTAQISGADEYMVFAGQLDGVDGIQPGYLMFLSTNQKVFVLHAYQTNADDLFALAELTIQEGRAPQTFGDFMILNLDEVAGDESAPEPASDGGYSDEIGNVFCGNDPIFEPFDLNGDGYVTQYEFSLVAGLSEEIDDFLATMVENGFDSIQVSGC